MKIQKKIGVATALFIVVSNMIGTGVFTSLGFQLAAVQNTWSIVLLWLIGGAMALFGAFAYAELGSNFTASGGDYTYLSKVLHPSLGYLSAWAGLIAGFTAPVALSAIAMQRYLAPVGINSWVVATVVVVVIAALQCVNLNYSSRLQQFTTVIKIGFIVLLIAIGLIFPATSSTGFNFSTHLGAEVFSPGFAVSMIYVSYAYTGWNAAAYITAEIDNPVKNLPRSLIWSTVLVSVAYVVFQLVLLKHAPIASLTGKEEVTYIAFAQLLGQTAGKWIGIFIAIQLIATISAYLWVGPRMTFEMAKAQTNWQWLNKQNSAGIPYLAIILHAAIAIVLALTGAFEKILLYTGFILQLMSMLTVACSLRIKSKKGLFSSPFKPVLQYVFLLFNGFVLVYTFVERPTESLLGIGLLVLGLLLYKSPIIKPEQPDHQN
jgi:basic amino acid/polyamine antiporter, APA family